MYKSNIKFLALIKNCKFKKVMFHRCIVTKYVVGGVNFYILSYYVNIIVYYAIMTLHRSPIHLFQTSGYTIVGGASFVELNVFALT